ncbi:hypothetical protein GCM10010218_25470 [Streptomyces mashuensis]|uniref:Zinc-finger domain-containing protein n=1 Tax=Streptomyces mashuensis TaxID=33904 RepID=A0A919B1S9_9ACTN|nr:hypothetical protein [Streptomyces mashuensis]GHF43103.1 hypothetical protein GCM10010218_25470 [Streptomyces mashuensis]
MTSRTGTDGHPEVAEISALTEGLLPPSRTADIREHLAGCELCDDVRTSLDEIRGLLGTLPGPPRMPADIAGRIDAALAAEALLSATAPEAPEDRTSVSRETGPRETGIDEKGAVSRETAPRPTPTRPSGRAPAATGPGRARARRWRQALVGAACAAAVIGAGTFFLQAGEGGGSHSDAAGTPNGRPTVSSEEAATLQAHVRELLLSTKSTESRGMSAEKPAETTLGARLTTAPACVRDGIGRQDQPLGTRPEKYRGEDAYLVVLPHPEDAGRVDAYVVSASCETTSPSVPGTVLVQHTFPRA